MSGVSHLVINGLPGVSYLPLIKYVLLFKKTSWLLLTGLLICIYLIKGLAGVYAWNITLFIVAPIAAIAGIICLITLLVRCIRKTASMLLLFYQLTFLLLAFPLLMLLGVVTVPFPDTANVDTVLVIDDPIGKDTVQLGGDSYKTHVMWPSERYAFDILIEPYDINSAELSDYGVFGRNIYSPVDATVIDVHDGEEDIMPNTDEFTSSEGNYVYLKIDKLDTYLVLAHLKKNSVSVKIGDKVKIGSLLGQVGNSGTTSEPHLHLQHKKQNPISVVYPICAEGLPIKFKE